MSRESIKNDFLVTKDSAFDRPESLNHEPQLASIAAKEQKSIGVEKAEILAEQWQTWYQKLILLFSAFLVGYAYGLDSQTRYIYTGYATDSFKEHSLLTTVSTITAFIAAGAQPVYARLSDVFGRLELFIASMIFYVMGTIIESQATDVQKFAAGSIFYQLGYTGAILVVSFILADFSSLRWRLFFSATTSFPFIINTWISGNVTEGVYEQGNWSWRIGMWAFIYPLACLPLICCMLHMRWKAGKTERWRVFKLRETKFQQLGWVEFLKYLFWKLDVIGLIIFLVALGCILIPITVAGGIKSKWQSGSIIAPLVIGFVLVPVFLVWEGKFAQVPMFPLHMLKDRGIWSASLISFLFDLISGIESSYLYTVLIVAIYESTKSATRILYVASFTSVVGLIPFGIFIAYFKKLKLFITIGCSLWMVALGMMIHYRAGEGSHDGIIGALVVMGIGTCFFTSSISITVQSCVNHEHMASAIALVYTLYRVGAAVGSSIAGAMWTQLLYKRLMLYLPATLAEFAYSSPYEFVAKYPKGTSERDAIVEAYKYIQKLLITVALVLCVPMVFSTFFLRDHTLGNEQSIEDIEQRQENDNFANFFRQHFRKQRATSNNENASANREA